MKAPKVVHLTSVHHALDPRIFKKECRSLARAGFDVTVVAPYPKDAFEEQVHIRSVKKHKSRIARMTRTVWNVFQTAKRLDADIYHFHDPELIPVALLLRSSGKRVVYDIHEDYPKDILFKEYLPTWSRRWISDMAARVEAAACRHFSALVSVSPSIADRLRVANSRTVIVCNYPYPEELIDNNPAPWETRRLATAYTGTVTAERGIPQIVQAMGLLPDSMGATLEIAGDRMLDEVKTLKGWDRVKFYGPVDQATVYQILRNVRIGLLCEHPIAGRVECTPVKLFEYMGAGLPVVASNFPLWRAMLGDMRCAIFVDPLNVREIADAVEYLLTHSEEAQEMGRRGQAAVLEHLNWGTQFPTLVRLYTDLVDEKCAA
ncbi:MAG TPA: glycosyltransferase family 4 protein [Candidatus Dormibacteraeota bacterium]|nr:glycosyltransferase family 4 protein [Candidatus Dormibacteraeota bacterium]